MAKPGRLFLLLLFLALTAGLHADSAADLVMKAVVRISGRSKTGDPVMGTGFLVQAGGSNRRRAWLVTAAHVFQQVNGDTVDLLLRRRKRERVASFEQAYQIRSGALPRFRADVGSDVAALLLELPADSDCAMLSYTMLAAENDFSSARICAGSDLMIFGFPYGESFADTGNCLIRSGLISSGPLTPVGDYPYFLADFEVFAGYSGAPVLVRARDQMLIAGMVLEEVFLEELRPGRKKTLRTSRGLGLARVINASAIRDFIAAQEKR